MPDLEIYLRNHFGSKWLGIGLFCGLSFMIDPAAFLTRTDSGAWSVAVAQTQIVQPLSANDVSWLFPAPVRVEDFDKLIAIRNLTTQNLQDPTKRDPVW